MTSLDSKTVSTALFSATFQRNLRRVVVLGLSIYLIVLLAQLSWKIIPQPALNSTTVKQTQSTNKPSSASTENSVNVAAIQRLNLFGKPSAEPAKVAPEPVTDAPETNLNLTLTGVVASSDSDSGAAIIEHRNSQATYGVGEKIEGTNAFLSQVLHDRVIIKNGPRNETLMLDGVDYKKRTSTQVSAANTASRTSRSTAQNRQLAEAAEAMRQQPASFTDFIAVTPKTRDNMLIGYEVKPGKNNALFNAAGLQANDIVTEINGLDVTEAQQAIEAMNELRTAQALALTVLRDGQSESLYLDIPEANNDE